MMIDELVRGMNYIDVAKMAVENEIYFPYGDSVAILLLDAYEIIKRCVEDLERGMENE